MKFCEMYGCKQNFVLAPGYSLDYWCDLISTPEWEEKCFDYYNSSFWRKSFMESSTPRMVVGFSDL